MTVSPKSRLFPQPARRAIRSPIHGSLHPIFLVTCELFHSLADFLAGSIMKSRCEDHVRRLLGHHVDGADDKTLRIRPAGSVFVPSIELAGIKRMPIIGALIAAANRAGLRSAHPVSRLHPCTELRQSAGLFARRLVVHCRDGTLRWSKPD